VSVDFFVFLFIMTEILLVEDNQQIGQNIVTYLQTESWVVDWYQNGIDWLKKALTYPYDLIILDVMLPGMDGFNLLQEVRRTKTTPVIMTTAKGMLEDKATWFGAGADDYLVKPFSLEELVLRGKAILKRTQQEDIYRYDDIVISLIDNIITKWDQSIHLTTKEFQVLSCLLDAYPSPVSRTDIIDFVWGGDAVFEHDAKLDVYISNLRKKLAKWLIETIKWFGYKVRLT